MKQPKPNTEFVICIRTDDDAMLTPRRIYRVLPDEVAARSNYIRVVDDEGEDYLYPADYFIAVEFEPAVERALMETA